MKYEKSCGAVVFNNDKVLLVKSKKFGHWSFPKGHMEENETKVETANREIFEETNLLVDINENVFSIIEYSPFPNVIKEVTYFYADYRIGETIPQCTEISEIKWLFIDEAYNLITFEQEKGVLKDILFQIKTKLK